MLTMNPLQENLQSYVKVGKQINSAIIRFIVINYWFRLTKIKPQLNIENGKFYSMKKVYQPAIILFIILQFVVAASIKDNQVPDSKIKMLNGRYAQLSDFNEDGPMIINFWTTW